jgi:hypothetical protein
MLWTGAAGALAFALVFPALMIDDSPSYLVPARSWAAGDGLREGSAPLESRLPLYPLVLGVIIRVAGESLRLFSLANVCLHAAGILLVRGLLRRRAPATVDALCGLALLYPPFLTSAGMVLQESLIAAVIGLFLVLGWKAIESPRPGRSFAAGLALGLAGLAKVTALPLLLPMTLLLASPRAAWRGRVAALWLGTLLAIAPWMVRNSVVLGRFEISNNNGGTTVLGGTVSNEIADWYRFPEYIEARERWLRADPTKAGPLDRYLYGVAFERIAARPGPWLGLAFERVFRFMLPARHWFVRTGRSLPATFGPWYLVAIAVQGVLFASAAWVALRTWRSGGPWTHLLPPTIVFLHLVVYALSYVSPRYNVTVAPALVACLVLAVTPRGGAGGSSGMGEEAG